MKKHIKILLPIILMAHMANGQGGRPKKVNVLYELQAFGNIAALPLFRSNTVEEEESTYDRTGGNNDGFSGTYSFARRNKDSSLVMFDIKGAGVINRFATPTPTNDTLDFYIDQDAKPALSICYRDLFSGKIYPFVQPLCGSGAGGYYCYFPILFQKHCMIVCRGKHLQFHQIQYRRYPVGTIVEKFHAQFSKEEKDALDQINILWNQEKGAQNFSRSNDRIISTSVRLLPGESKTIFKIEKGGRITGIELSPASAFTGVNNGLSIRITWDHSRQPALDCPVADLFGYAFGSPSMQSLLLGSVKGRDYCYFPMPFDSSATVTLVNSAGGTPIQCTTKIFYNERKRVPGKEGKFYTCYRKNELSENDPFHVFLNTRGRGHYIGTILLAQGIGREGTVFFEGDDTTATDGIFRIHGTGSEDYFNGGWYDVKGRWDTARSFPLSGCLYYSHAFSRTGGYRFYLSDKLPFAKSIYQAIEHGPTIKGIPAIYKSISFYYKENIPNE